MQEKSGNRTSQFESGSLALKYRLDNEFELVFIAAFQKMLPLLYLDKLLDEIQLLFRDKFSKHLQVRNEYHKTLVIFIRWNESYFQINSNSFKSINIFSRKTNFFLLHTIHFLQFLIQLSKKLNQQLKNLVMP